MDEKRLIGEQLVRAWLNLSSTMWNRRVVSSMTFNEMFVCSLLRHRAEEDPQNPFTATELCERTGLLKSQMNKVLNAMEENGYISRVRSDRDKRFVYIELSDSGTEQYLKEHEGIMLMIDRLVDAVGLETAAKTTESVNIISDELRKLL